MGGKEAVDLSQFMLFEAAGDSDAAFDTGAGEDGRDRDEDDAESCSYDADSKSFRDTQLEIVHGDREKEDDTKFDSDVAEQDCDRRDVMIAMAGDKEEEEEESEEVVSEVASTANSYCVRRCERPSKRRKMSEVEKSRLFWEACLAS